MAAVYETTKASCGVILAIFWRKRDSVRTFLCEQPCECRRHAVGVLPGGAVAAALVDGLVDAASRRDEGGGIPIDIGFRAVCADGLAADGDAARLDVLEDGAHARHGTGVALR